MTRTPWTPDHVARIERPALPMQSRGGYVVADVQLQLDRIAGLMRAGRPVPPIATSALRRSYLRPGYAPEPVEALFSHVGEWQRQFDEAAHSAATAALADRSSSAESASDERRLNWTRQQQVWVREMQFPSARRSAYEVGEVDDFLDRVLVAMAKGEELPDVQSAKFYMARLGRSGYDSVAVDHFLDQLTRLRPAL
ncbi:hypothetical protein HJ588_04795 [Flexivirga sp. ID2601S]|uniref:DivIVA domain-containing protein n=1 Tax=Flexivirga aerilata TaxID=1656889 RepID=A0A849ADL5_9MICO|nr:hypothetical protein [Flexivirga aerilata]NNG38595.1 hypothetical protein [Flexivirga aerilata]